MSQALDRLTTDVADLRSVTASVLTLISGLAQAIRDNVDDSAALNALADDIEAQRNSLAAAVTDNTTTPASPPAA